MYEFSAGNEYIQRGSLPNSSQSPTPVGLTNEHGPAMGLFKRRNAFWKVDANRAGSVPDVPETKKLMAFPITANDGSSHSSMNQHATNSFISPNKSKMSVQNRTDRGDMKDYKPR